MRKRRSGRHNGREERKVTVHVQEEEERDDEFRRRIVGLRLTLRAMYFKEEEDRA